MRSGNGDLIKIEFGYIVPFQSVLLFYFQVGNDLLHFPVFYQA